MSGKRFREDAEIPLITTVQICRTTSSWQIRKSRIATIGNLPCELELPDRSLRQQMDSLPHRSGYGWLMPLDDTERRKSLGEIPSHFLNERAKLVGSE